jgi:hypothetical protein
MIDSLRYVKISGPGVDTLDNRKECGSLHEVTTQELRASIDKVKEANFAGFKLLNASVIARFN